MEDLQKELQAFEAALRLRYEALEWLKKFEAALGSGSAEDISKLFHEDSYWRDVLAFTWYITPLSGRNSIAHRIYADQARTQAKCPSSNDLRPIGGLCNGVSGPSGFKVRLRFVDASSGDAGWFCA